MPAVLILLTLLLPLGDGAEEIIGGHEVKPHTRPYMALVSFLKVNGKRSYCGGFLVRDYFVLTAAHCIGSAMTVILGAHNLHEKEETQQIINVDKAFPHPDYNPLDHSNDIMVLKLESKAKRSNSVKPLKLPGPKGQVNPGDVCGVAGWGKTSINSTKGSALLEEAEVIIQEDEECKKHFRHYSEITEICAGDPSKIEAPSKGDSGGPLVCDNKAYGILSYVKSKKISSGIFTKVVYFLPWINKNMILL
ncbi:granzyme E-like isoform X2 [Apodemus sylvaticus]|uniref:granzyme E-like isoform X2 n=1 Tax=Apodemus sylvaticus TaxID=10129 RepID=UPI002242CBC5|nr:granzyme E-like isoform X2 [Apodemus sylvaticus]